MKNLIAFIDRTFNRVLLPKRTKKYIISGSNRFRYGDIMITSTGKARYLGKGYLKELKNLKP